MNNQKKILSIEEARERLRLLTTDAKRAQKISDRKVPEFPTMTLEMFEDEKAVAKYERKEAEWNTAFDEMMKALDDSFEIMGEANAIIKDYPELRDEFKELFD